MTAARQGPAIAALAVTAALLWYFHNRFWWPVDEGIYAYVAQRLLAGDRLHLELIDLHGGYGNLVNALAFRLFGEDLLSLRYPLVLATLAQATIAWALLRHRSAVAAGAGALAVGTLSFIQFLNPSANWYALAIFFVTALTLGCADPRRARDLLVIGLLCGLCFFVRQLSGVILGLGAVTVLMLRLPADEIRAVAGRALAARALVAVMAAGLALYLASKGSLFAFVAVGAWPLGILVLAFLRIRASDRDVGRVVLWVGLGTLLAGVPLAVAHALDGALVPWLRDVFVTALLIHGQDFISQPSFGYLALGGLRGIVAFQDPAAVVNGLFWLVAVLALPATGILALAHVARTRAPEAVAVLPVLAVFWAVVAVHYQVPVYLFFALPATMAGLVWLVPRLPLAAAVVAACACAVAFQAGQPISRSLAEVVEGKRVPLDATATLPRVSLAIEESDRAVYAALLERIEAVAGAEEPLMTLPMDPEINFMTGRRSPQPYYGTPLGLRTEADVTASVARLKAAAPLFVVHRREDKYLTPLSEQLLAEVRALAPAPEPFGPFDLYRVPAP